MPLIHSEKYYNSNGQKFVIRIFSNVNKITFSVNVTYIHINEELEVSMFEMDLPEDTALDIVIKNAKVAAEDITIITG